MKNFTAIDFETAISHHICAVGIVTVENGKITDEYHTLIKPPNNEYNWHNIQIHRITETVIPNYELNQLILKHGNTVKVIEPEWLADEIKENLKRTLGKYE